MKSRPENFRPAFLMPRSVLGSSLNRFLSIKNGLTIYFAKLIIYRNYYLNKQTLFFGQFSTLKPEGGLLMLNTSSPLRKTA